MNTRTHDIFGKKWSTGLPLDKIKAINRAIDNPSHISARVQREAYHTTGGYYNPFDLLELGKHSGHRQVGHSILDAMFTGFTIGGTEGARAAMTHVLLDGLSDRWKHMMGSAAGRDMIESALVYNMYKD